MIKTSPLKVSLSLALLLAAGTLRAQEFGGNPPSIKWNQVNTPESKVIFPQGMDSIGRRVADIIHRMNGAIQPTIGYKRRQVSILLQNQTTISNAYVGLAPFRSEFFLTPEQNSFELGSLPWADQLAIHEYRHVQQYNNYNVGASKVLHVLFGEAGQALGNELSVPNWFFEGDAVYNETHVSEQGRGRLPYFFNGYRALWAAGKDYSYKKLRNGSLLDFTPDHYPLGYMLVSYGREQYGNTFWRDVTHDAAAYTFGFNPLQKSFKHYAGQDFTQFTKAAFQYYKQQFNDAPLSGYKKNQHFIASQEYPAFVDEQTVVYMKSTYNRIPVFVLRTGNTEKEVRVRDLSLDNYFAYHDGKIIYAAYRPDARWGYRNYSELRVIDIHTGEEKALTHNTKYFAPDFSADGKTIVAAEETPDNKCAIHLLSADDGHLIAVVPNPKQLFFTYPKFYNQEQLVSAVRHPDGRMSLDLVDIKSGKLTELVAPGFAPITFPAVKQDTIYFAATSGNRDRLYALAGKTRLYELNNDSLQNAIGNYQPAVGNGKMAWVSFTAYGYQVHQTDKNALKWTPVGNAMPALPDLGITSLKKDSAANLLATVNNAPLPVTKYNKGHGLFNFHSILPTFNDPDYTLSLVGENVLNTFQSSLDLSYNRDEGYKEIGFSGVYGALFPYLRGGVSYIMDRKGYYSKTNSDVYWNETEVSAGAGIPLTFTNGTQITNLSFGTDVIYNSTNFQQPYRSQFSDRSYTYLSNYLTLTNRIQQAKQNIYPRLAESLTIRYKTAVSNISASQFLASGALYLPGIGINHNLVLTGAFQQNGRNSVISFSNSFPFSRGYTAENLYQLDKFGINYHFPIAYPDKGIGNTVYFQRIRGNAFFDYTHANDFYVGGSPFKANFRSVGGEVYFDTQWFNQVPITFGLRYSHLLDDNLFGAGNGHDMIEFIVPLTLF